MEQSEEAEVQLLHPWCLSDIWFQLFCEIGTYEGDGRWDMRKTVAGGGWEVWDGDRKRELKRGGTGSNSQAC